MSNYNNQTPNTNSPDVFQLAVKLSLFIIAISYYRKKILLQTY